MAIDKDARRVENAFYGLQWWVMNAPYLSGNAPPIDNRP